MPPSSNPEIPFPKLLLLVGPTASGKTEVAIELCELLNGEIISADSTLVYRGLDIGTAKPTRDEQERARHHLIDIREPDQEYSAAEWARDAKQVINEIASRGKQSVVVGGTGFYVNALLGRRQLAGAPPNPELRQELEELAAREGVGVLHARLAEVDAVAAARLHPNDVMRVVRAIEVALAPPVAAPEPEENHAPEYSAFGLEMPRELLYERINARVDAMLEQGFLQELSTLIAAGYGEAAPLKSLGYKQMRAFLEGRANRDEAIEEWKRDTRRYAKRQGTWFRHQLDVEWIDAVREDGIKREASEIAREIAGKFRVM